MPNWCHNVITVSGTKKNMQKYYDCLKLTEHEKQEYMNNVEQYENCEGSGEFLPLSFQKTVPVEIRTVFTQHDAWGTMWDLGLNIDSQEILEQSPKRHVIRCDTAWYNPDIWAKTLNEKFGVNVRIAFIECCTRMCGVFKVNDHGNSVKNYDYVDELDYDEDTNDYIYGERLDKFMKKNKLNSIGG